MRRVVAPLAAVLAFSLAAAGCGGGEGGEDGAEPGASREATLVLDFTPNAVHTGIYTALARGHYEDEGVDLEIREPSASTDAPKLLEAGRADFAILDIHDLGIAVERGLDVKGVAAIVGRPLAAVLAQPEISRPSELEGRRVGVTGLPSDDAVLDSVVDAYGGDPAAVDRVTIGFNAVATLAAGRVDAATAFWNAEGVALRERGIPIREFRVDRYGAPPYPELVLVTSRELLRSDRELIDDVVAATARGHEDLLADPDGALDELLEQVPDLDRASQEAQLDVLLPALGTRTELDPAVLVGWVSWDVDHGILSRPAPVEAFFDEESLGEPAPSG